VKNLELIINETMVEEKELRKVLSQLFGRIKKLEIEELGRGVLGTAYELKLGLEKGERKVVLKAEGIKGFGHDYPWDRGRNLIEAHQNYNKLPLHVRSYGVFAISKGGKILPANSKNIGDVVEFFQLREKAEGRQYSFDLEEIKERGNLLKVDWERAKLLSDYLARIHERRFESPEIYQRRIRDLVGHGEGIAGIIDTYPRVEFTSLEELTEIEKICVEHRNRIKAKHHRLCSIHGDFHPWNIWFKGSFLKLTDRSRGEWGEPADDLTCLTINYIFFSLRKYGNLAGPFKELFDLFWRNYLEKTQDREMLSVVQPFYAWRCLVIANPLFYPQEKYPDITAKVRRKIINFARNVLKEERFDLEKVNLYLG
jgi:hypothetical protein